MASPEDPGLGSKRCDATINDTPMRNVSDKTELLNSDEFFGANVFSSKVLGASLLELSLENTESEPSQ